MINDEDMKVLEGYQNSFRTAIENNYCRNLGVKKYNELNAIYQRITNARYVVNWGCPHCAIRFVQALGKLYFEELALRKQQESEKNADKEPQVQKGTEPKDVTASAPKRKGGRPKKQATNNEQKSE